MPLSSLSSAAYLCAWLGDQADWQEGVGGLPSPGL